MAKADSNSLTAMVSTQEYSDALKAYQQEDRLIGLKVFQQVII